jgi:O-antigen ligase
MVLGSSSVTEAIGPGRKLRWAALVLLTGVGLALALRDRRRTTPGAPLRRVLVLGSWFAALSIVSAAWSVDSRLTFERACSLALLFVAAAALALAARTRPTLPVRLLQGIFLAATACAVAGLFVLAFRHSVAVQAATVQYPARYDGLGQNPDTIAMLVGIAFPIGLWLFLRASTMWGRAFTGTALLLFVGTIAASGSRGGIVASLAGGVLLSLVYPAPLRRRVAAALVVVVAMAAGTAVSQIPKPLPLTVTTTSPTGKKTTVTPVLPPLGAPVGVGEQQYGGRLQDEVDRFQTGPRSLFQTSGRLEAWRGAVGQADARPALGYGFGTESMVFLDRFYAFNGQYVENSFIGVYLQLGAVGLISFLALLAVAAVAGVRAIRAADADSPGPALAAVVATGIVLMLVQSYAYSVGNVVTVAFWVCSFGVTAVSSARQATPADAPELAKRGSLAPA